MVLQSRTDVGEILGAAKIFPGAAAEFREKLGAAKAECLFYLRRNTSDVLTEL